MKKKKIMLKKVISVALAVALVVPAALSGANLITAHAADSAAAAKTVVSTKTGPSTTDYLSDNVKKSKAKEAASMSEEYWEEEAPADVQEAAEMYVEDATDGEVKASNSGADDDSANIDKLKVTTAEKKFDENGLRETAHYVRVTYTIANKDYLKVKTIDDLFDKNEDAFLGSTVTTSQVYESKKNDDCYIAFLNYGKLNDLSSKIIDADFVTNVQSNPKNVEDDVVFDKNTGIVYIPKSYYFATDGTELGYDLQAQILVAPELNKKIEVSVQTENHSSAKLVQKTGTAEFTPFNSLTFPLVTKDTANKISFSDIHVYLNDSASPAILEDGEGASYDKETGEYTLNKLASTIYSVKFVIGGKSVAQKVADFVSPVLTANAAKIQSGADMNYVINVTTGKPISPSIEYDKLKVGYTYGYTGKNTTADEEAVEKILKAGQEKFIYAPIFRSKDRSDDIRDTFYDYLTADGDNAKSLKKLLEQDNIDGIVNVEDQTNDAQESSGQTHDKYWWYKFTMEAPSGTLKEVHGNGTAYFGEDSEWKWSDTFEYQGKTKYRNMYAGACCHVGAPDLAEQGKKTDQVSILEKGDGYVVLGLAQTKRGTDSKAQAGAAIIKIQCSHNLSLKKVSSNPEISENNDCYDLAGAQYGVYKTNNNGQLSDNVGTLTTNGEGVTNTLTLPSGIYYVREDVPPKGFEDDLDPNTKEKRIYTVDLRSKDYVLNVSDKPGSDPLVITIHKIDKETGGVKLGAASLAGAEFTIKYYDGYYNTVEELEGKEPERTWVLVTQNDENLGLTGLYDEYLTPSSDKLYYDGKFPAIPCGTITIQETKAPEGYNLDWNTIDANGNTKKGEDILISQVTLDVKTNITSVKAGHEYTNIETVERADFSFRKKDEETQQLMAGIPFKITSQSTGESHIIVTDANGSYSSANEIHPHTQDTNANDEVKDGKYNDKAGLWFGQYEDTDGSIKTTKVDDSRGALPYDTYDIEEIRCEANEGKALFKGKFVINEETSQNKDKNPNLGDIENADLVIETTAKNDATGTHYAEASTDVTIVDTVEYWGLTEKNVEYKIVGTLMDKETGKALLDAEGNPITTEKTFKPKTSEGQVEVEFTFDASALKGKDVVAFEELYLDTDLKAEHKDIDDEDQTVHFPEIETQAQDAVTESNVTKAAQDITIKDIVTFKGLKPNKTYTVKGTLMDKETGKPALDDNGKEITTTAEFTPEESDGQTEVTFTFSGVKLEGHTLVAFEELYYKNDRLAVHTDIEDDDQTVYIPKVDTEAKDIESNTHNSLADEKITVVDVVKYENLFVGKEYTVSGVLMDKSTNQPLLVDGKEVTAEATFTPEAPSGQIELTFEFNGSALAGKTVVAFETLYQEGKEVGAHTDINDDDQSIYVPEVKTNAKDKADGDKKVAASKTAKVVDKVTYKNLVPGRKYKVSGTLMDKTTKKALVVNGKAVTAEKTFTPKKSSGSVELTFKFNASALKGKKLVAFEKLFDVETNAEIANHEDIKDKAQTVEVVKKTSTSSGGSGGSGSTSSRVQTGDTMKLYVMLGAGAVLILAGAFLFFRKRKNS